MVQHVKKSDRDLLITPEGIVEISPYVADALLNRPSAFVIAFERGLISERIKDAKRAARRDGLHLGGARQFGYDIADGKLVPNEREQQAIAWMRRRRKRGKSLMTIRDAVRKSGVPISHETVRQVLARPETETMPSAPMKPKLKFPAHWVDETAERSGETLTIIGARQPSPRRLRHENRN